MNEQEKLARVALGVMTWEDFLKLQGENKIKTSDYYRGYQDGLAFAQKMFDEIYGKKESNKER